MVRAVTQINIPVIASIFLKFDTLCPSKKQPPMKDH